MPLQRSFVFAAMLLIAVGPSARAQPPVVVTEIDRTIGSAMVRGYAAQVDLTHGGVDIVVTDGIDAPGGAEAQLLPTDDWREQSGVELAVNANFFASLGGGAADIIGLSISDGEVISPVRTFNGEPDPAVVFDEDGTASAGRIGVDALGGLADAVAGVGPSTTDSVPGTLLVDDGVNTGTTARVQPLARNPRTAAGVDESGETLILIVIDGRQPGWSDGVTLPELADLMIEFGAHDAVNLDGGGSSSFLYDRGGVQLENRPSDGAHRPVANHLGVEVSEAQNPAPEDDPRPIRGAWLRPPNTLDAFDTLLDNCAEAGVTDLFLETFYHGLASNQSDVFNDRFGFDYLEEAIERGRLRGVRVHAWLEAAYWSFGGLGDYILDQHPEWKVVDDDGQTDIGDIPGQVFVNLGHPGVQQTLADYCTELASEYPMLWGLHTDYHRFPLDNDEGDGQEAPYSFDDWSRSAFESAFGVDPLLEARFPSDPFYDEFVQWRRDGIAEAAGVMNDAIVAADAGKQFSGAIFATAIETASGQPNPTQLVKMQDWPQMAARGWLPIVIPMAYGFSEGSIRNDLIATRNQASGARVVPGLAIISPGSRPTVSEQLGVVYSEGFDSFVFFEATTLVGTAPRRAELASFLEANGPYQSADINEDGRVDGLDYGLFYDTFDGTPLLTGGPLDLNGDRRVDGEDEAELLHQFRSFRFGADGEVGVAEFAAVLEAFTAPGETWPLHLFDLTADGVVNCDDVRRLRTLTTREIPIGLNPDLDGDGDVAAPDAEAFVSLAIAGDARADLNQSGSTDIFDVLRYVEAAAAACP